MTEKHVQTFAVLDLSHNVITDDSAGMSLPSWPLNDILRPPYSPIAAQHFTSIANMSTWTSPSGSLMPVFGMTFSNMMCGSQETIIYLV